MRELQGSNFIKEEILREPQRQWEKKTVSEEFEVFGPHGYGYSKH